MRYMMFVATDPEAETYDAAQDNIAEWLAYVTSAEHTCTAIDFARWKTPLLCASATGRFS